jgi:mRNA interferase RelE/StbE
LPREAQARIVNAVTTFSENSCPAGCKKLKGQDAWRIRIGDYRVIIDEIRDDALIVLVVRGAHRQETYKACIFEEEQSSYIDKNYEE